MVQQHHQKTMGWAGFQLWGEGGSIQPQGVLLMIRGSAECNVNKTVECEYPDTHATYAQDVQCTNSDARNVFMCLCR